MVTDGFLVTDRVYLLAQSMASQSPHATNFLAFPRALLTTSVVHWTPLVTTEGTIYSFTLTYKTVSADITYTVGAAATVGSAGCRSVAAASR